MACRPGKNQSQERNPNSDYSIRPWEHVIESAHAWGGLSFLEISDIPNIIYIMQKCWVIIIIVMPYVYKSVFNHLFYDHDIPLLPPFYELNSNWTWVRWSSVLKNVSSQKPEKLVLKTMGICARDTPWDKAVFKWNHPAVWLGVFWLWMLHRVHKAQPKQFWKDSHVFN